MSNMGIEMNIEELKEIIEQFSNARVLVIGDLMLDKFIQGTVSRLSPEAPVPVVDVISETFRPGGAANAITNIRALGGNVVAVGVTGDDWNGRKLRELLKQDNVDTECIIAGKKWQTTVKTRIIAAQQQIVRIDREKQAEIGDEDTKTIQDFLNKKIDDVDAILISDYDKGMVTNRLLEDLIPLAKKFGKPVVVHPKVVHFLDYKGVTIVNSSIERASTVTGIHQVNETSIRNMGQWLLTQLECEYVLITCGNDGMSLFERSGCVTQIPAVTEKMCNVTGVGAGDTVTSLIALSLASGVTNMVNSAILANIGAGVVVEKLGTATLTRDELKDRLNKLKGVQLAFAKGE